jgi:hypothetical protein
MNFPVEISYDPVQILDYGKNWLIEHLQGQLGDIAWRQVIRALGTFIPVLRTADPHELRTRVGRVEATVAGLADEIERLRAICQCQPSNEEMREPTAQDFIADSFAASMESPSEDKRTLLGRLIAQRLYVSTESSDELLLRQALSLARKMNEGQLRLLATISLVEDPPILSGMNRQQLYTWYDANLLNVLRSLKITDPDYGDLQYLVSIGAVTHDWRIQEQLYSGLREHAPNMEQKLFRATGEHATFGNLPHGEFFREAMRLSDGHFTKRSGLDRVGLAPYEPTAADRILGSELVEHYRRVFSTNHNP